MTTIHDVIGYVGPGENTDIRRINAIRRVYPRAYGAVLLACARKQVRLLSLLWGSEFPDKNRLQKALEKLVDEGSVPILLNHADELAKTMLTHRYFSLPGVDN